MVRVSEQLRNAVRRQRVVITADRPTPVNEHESRAMDGTRTGFFFASDRQLKSVARQRSDRIDRAGKKIPAERLFAELVRINAQDFRRVLLRIDAERNETHIGFREWLLQFAHSRADDRARTWARRENEVCDPDFPGERTRPEWLDRRLH